MLHVIDLFPSTWLNIEKFDLQLRYKTSNSLKKADNLDSDSSPNILYATLKDKMCQLKGVGEL
jgi:hypothetical protein